MAWIWIAVAVVTAVVYLLLANKIKRLPPGPWGFPIFGSLYSLGKCPHHDLHKLARKYGPIMHMRLGLVPTIVVSSPQAAELFLKKHDLVFASRPPHEAAKYLLWEQRNLSFAPYGSYWRDMRKMCTLELLSSAKINSFSTMRKEEVGNFLKFIRKAACDRAVVDLSAKITNLNADMSCRMVLGRKYAEREFDEKGFKAINQEFMHLAALPNMGDYIPFIAPLDLQGLTRRMKAVNKVFDEFFEKIIDEHLQSKDEHETKDFVDVMLNFLGSKDSEYYIERPHIKAILLVYIYIIHFCFRFLEL